MKKSKVAIVRYRQPLVSVKEAVALSQGLSNLPPNARVFVKPNIVYWTGEVVFPKWGMITTSRVVEDMIRVLKDHGISDITVGEGMFTRDKNDTQTPARAFEALGYARLAKKYGVKIVNIFQRPFEKVDLGQGISLNFNADILASDFVVDLPVLKCHNQTIVSLGIKNFKGIIDVRSRKRCHNADRRKNLHFHVARLADKLPPLFVLIDGIYSMERGPAMDGRVRRSDLLVASSDILSADMVGSRVLGYEPSQVPHLVHAAENRGRPIDLSDVDVAGEGIQDVAGFHEYDFQYTVDEHRSLPTPMAAQGLEGVYYRKYDDTMCSYCSGINGLTLTAIRYAWQGKPWDGIEVIHGKRMAPSPGMKKTILLGKCIYKLHKDNPVIREMIPVKGCPPKPRDILKALHQAGIAADPGLFANVDALPGFFMSRYQNNPDFDESFFEVPPE